jgi:hypothetical protein
VAASLAGSITVPDLADLDHLRMFAGEVMPHRSDAR